MKHRQLQPFRTAPSAAMAQFNEGQSELDNCIFQAQKRLELKILKSLLDQSKWRMLRRQISSHQLAKCPLGDRLIKASIWYGTMHLASLWRSLQQYSQCTVRPRGGYPELMHRCSALSDLVILLSINVRTPTLHLTWGTNPGSGDPICKVGPPQPLQ